MLCQNWRNKTVKSNQYIWDGVRFFHIEVIMVFMYSMIQEYKPKECICNILMVFMVHKLGFPVLDVPTKYIYISMHT